MSAVDVILNRTIGYQLAEAFCSQYLDTYKRCGAEFEKEPLQSELSYPRHRDRRSNKVLGTHGR